MVGISPNNYYIHIAINAITSFKFVVNNKGYLFTTQG